MNCGMTLSRAFGNMLLPIFQLNAITDESYHQSGAPADWYNWCMARATWFCMYTGGAALLIYISFQPKSKQQTRDWHSDARWHRPIVGIIGLTVAMFSFLCGVGLSFLSLMPYTMCLRIA